MSPFQSTSLKYDHKTALMSLARPENLARLKSLCENGMAHYAARPNSPATVRPASTEEIRKIASPTFRNVETILNYRARKEPSFYSTLDVAEALNNDPPEIRNGIDASLVLDTAKEIDANGRTNGIAQFVPMWSGGVILVQGALPRNMLSGTLVHEIAHCLQFDSGHFEENPESTILHEGHAIGVQRLVARTQGLIAQDQLLEHDVIFLISVLAYFNIPIEADLSSIIPESPLYHCVRQYLEHLKAPAPLSLRPHHFGAALFMLVERVHGPDIYSHALRGNFEFLRI